LEISSGIYLIPGTMAHVYMIVEASGLTLMDTGLRYNHYKIIRYISRLGFNPHNIKNILITHSDYDHYGSLSTLRKVSQAKVYASMQDAAAMNKGESSRSLKPAGLLGILYRLTLPFFRAKPSAVDEIIRDGQILPIQDGIQVIATPGHCQGHTSYYLPSRKILFCGDSLRSANGVLTASIQHMRYDQTLAQESVRKQAALEPDIVCPGHGPVIFDAKRKFPAL